MAGMANSNDVLPLYIGDDRTDEDAFKAMLIFHLPVSLDIFVAHDYCVINVAERTFSVSCWWEWVSVSFCGLVVEWHETWV